MAPWWSIPKRWAVSIWSIPNVTGQPCGGKIHREVLKMGMPRVTQDILKPKVAGRVIWGNPMALISYWLETGC